MHRKFLAVIFDVDGTLVDSNDLHAQAWREAFLDKGIDVPFAKVRRLIGMGGDKLVYAATGIPGESPVAKALVTYRAALFKKRYLPRIKPFPHARDLLLRLRAEAYRLVVGTSAQADEADGILKQTGLNDLFDAFVTGDDAGSSKPSPDIVCAALTKADVNAANAIMIGDTPYDIEAASKAGVATIALRTGGWRDVDLKGALAIYDSPVDLLERFASSPLKAL